MLIFLMLFISHSQLSMVCSRTDAVLLRAGKSHPLLGFRGKRSSSVTNLQNSGKLRLEAI